MKRFGFLFLGMLLFLAGALRDAGDQWISDTDLPLILTETSTEVRDRNGLLNLESTRRKVAKVLFNLNLDWFLRD